MVLSLILIEVNNVAYQLTCICFTLDYSKTCFIKTYSVNCINHSFFFNSMHQCSLLSTIFRAFGVAFKATQLGAPNQRTVGCQKISNNFSAKSVAGQANLLAWPARQLPRFYFDMYCIRSNTNVLNFSL